MAEGYRHLPAHLADALHSLAIGARRPMAGGNQGLHRSLRHGASVEFAEYRPYVPGDPPQLIDWSAYARCDRHLVRRFEEETNLTGWILLDCSASLAWQGRRAGSSKLDYACSLAASLLYVLVGQGDRAGLITFADGIIERHAPAGSAPALVPQLHALEAVSSRGRGDIARSLHDACLVIPRRSLVLLVSDLLQAPSQVAGALAHLQHEGHDVRVLHLIDRAELQLEPTGLVELKDLETGELLEVDLEEVRESYAEAVAGHLDDIRRAAGGSGAEYRLVDTQTAIHQVVRGLA